MAKYREKNGYSPVCKQMVNVASASAASAAYEDAERRKENGIRFIFKGALCA